MRLEVNNISYFVEVYQQDTNKEYLVLLHGFMGSGTVFDSIINSLKTFCNPITIDLLGHGKTGSASSAKRFQANKQVEDLVSIIKSISDEPVYLYGYSMGGRLALQFAQKSPTLLKGLILESTNPGLKDPLKRKERQQLDSQRARRIKKDFNRFLADWKELPLFKKSTVSERHLKHYQQIQQRQDPQQMAYSLQRFGTGKMPAVDLTKIKIPTLLLAGQKDKKYVSTMKQMNTNIAKSSLKIIRNAGHRVHLDKPNILTSTIKSFTTS